MSPELISLEKRIEAAKVKHGITDAEIRACIQAQRLARVTPTIVKIAAGFEQFSQSLMAASNAMSRLQRIDT